MSQKQWFRKCLPLGLMKFVRWIGAFGAVASQTFITANNVLAQSNIVPDNTLGTESSRVISNFLNQPVEAIAGGAVRGVNLFHSFQEFNISAERNAYFFSPDANIQNILARVTGRNSSEILGILGTFGDSRPNIFLINPNGIVFGPNASLNIGGSFVATTANAIKLGETGLFSATQPASSNLMSVNPSALFYNAVINQAQIINRSVDGLGVLKGKSLLLVGGNVRLEGGLLDARGGRVELGGLNSPGTVEIKNDGNIPSLSFPTGAELADVSLINRAAAIVASDSGGSITVNARNIDFLGRSLLYAGIASRSGTATSQAGDITLNATEAIRVRQESGIINNVFLNAIGTSGNINMNTGSLSVTNGAQVQAITYGQGNAGNVIINASDTVSLDGTSANGGFLSSIGTIVEQTGRGNGGDIRIDTGSLFLSNGARLVAGANGQGDAGDIIINARNTVSFSGTTPDKELASAALSRIEESGTGKGGNISITTKNLSLTDGVQLGTSTSGKGNAGSVSINASETVSFDGENTAISTGVQQMGKGQGGDINITTSSFSISNGAALSAKTNGEGNAGTVTINASDTVFFSGISGITSKVEEQGIGQGGDIRITTEKLLLTKKARLIASNDGKGAAGNITIDARNNIFTEDAVLNTNTSGKGAAGNITINSRENTFFDNSDAYSTVEKNGTGRGGDIRITSGTISLTNGSRLLSVSRGQGNSGSVILDSKNSISLDGSNTGIASRVEMGGIGHGGDIRITTDSLSVTNDAELIANTRGEGDAGNIIINARSSLSLMNGAVLTVGTSGKGDGGSVIIDARDRVWFDRGSAVFSGVQENGVGNGRDINISTDSLRLTNGSQLLSITSGNGNAGNVTINARSTVSVDGKNSAILSRVDTENSKGNAGDIRITTNNLSITNSAALTANTSGQGNAGNTIIDASSSVFLNGGGIFSNVRETGTGKAGDIRINTGFLSIINGAQLQASTFGKGDAGSVIIDAREQISFDGKSVDGFTSGVGSGVIGFDAVGKGGDVRITTNLLSLTNGAGISVSTYGKGDAGNVIIDARSSVNFSNGKIFSTVDETGVGKGGNIYISTNSLALNDEATISASTSGKGDAGNLIINARDRVWFDSGSAAFSSVSQKGIGNGGDIRINTANFSVANGAALTASTSGRGNAGNLIINASDRVSFNGETVAFSTVEPTGIGKGGDIRITTKDLSLSNGAVLTARTRGQGDAGNIQINATDSVNIFGSNSITGLSSALFTFTNSNSSKGGNISVNSKNFRISDGALLDARTTSDSNAGDITVNANLVEALNGGQIVTSTFGSGRAGKITINATDRIVINGSEIAFNERVTKFSDNVRNISPTSGFFVLSKGSGIAGDIEINSPLVTLDNQGKLIAESASGNGGNIKLQVRDLLLLRRGGQISTNAGTELQGGDGGNINVNSKYIVAVPEEDSDLTANAYTGTGGQVQINSQGIFGIEARSRPTNKSDITASSELGIAGVTNINSPDTSSLRNSLNQLPENIIDTNALIASSCIARRKNSLGGTFFVIGNGGLPERPGDAPLSPYLTGTMQSVPTELENSATPTTSGNSWTLGDPIVEPQGAYQLANGLLVLSRECP